MKNKYIALLIILVVIFTDQLTKWFVLENFLREDVASTLNFFEWYGNNDRLPFAGYYIAPFLNFVMVWNEGISFGLFNGLGNTAIILSLLSIAISAGLAVWMFKTDQPLIRYTLAMVIGGAIGNVIDRLRFGAVADFIDFHLFGLHWPAFNLSDSAITLGIIILVIDSFMTKKTS